MALSRDLMGIGVTAEESIRVGDTGPKYLTGLGGSAISTATQIGGYNAETLLELNPTTNAVSSVVFVSTVELDRTYTLVNSNGSNAANVFPPTSVASFNGLTGGVSFSLPANKVAFVTRMGPIPNPTGSIAADRWIYTLSN